MSVAEKSAADTATQPRQQLALHSLLGGVFILVFLWVIFAGLPELWTKAFGVKDGMLPLPNDFLSEALLLVATMVVGVGLGYLAHQLEKTYGQHGWRAGTIFAALWIYLIAWFSLEVVGGFLETREMDVPVLVIVNLAVALGLGYGALRVVTSAAYQSWLMRIEDQGWFHALPYKPTQGVRVRRGTVLALLVLGVCGLITMISHRVLGSDRLGLGTNNWEWVIPFTANEAGSPPYLYIPLMFKVHLVLPLVLAAALLWFAWRMVNWPTFADFLIATEAEMNKVSWTTRKRLFQDTIVVLVTVFLITAFLFVIDILWIWVLSNPFFQILHVNLKEEQQKQQEKTQW